MSDLMQAGFFEAESSLGENDAIVISADWMTLSDDDFRQAATERHRELDQQEAVIDEFKNRIIREKGELYMAAKAKLEHGQYLNWLKEVRVSADKAQTYAQIARDLREELANADRGRHLSYRVWRGIVRSPERKQIVAKIESGEIAAAPRSYPTPQTTTPAGAYPIARTIHTDRARHRSSASCTDGHQVMGRA